MNFVGRLSQSTIRSQVIKSNIINPKILSNTFSRIMSATEKPQRVLSIQSHVVHGYCGNKSAVFPLQVSE